MAQANIQMVNKIAIGSQARNFGLCENNESVNLNRPLLDSEYVCDVLSRWDGNNQFKFVFCKKYVMEDSEKILEEDRLWLDDKIAFELFFSQVKFLFYLLFRFYLFLFFLFYRFGKKYLLIFFNLCVI